MSDSKFSFTFLFSSYFYVYNEEPVHISYEKHLWKANEAGKSFRVYPWNLDNYRNEEDYARVNYIADYKGPWVDIIEAHCRPVNDLSRNYKYDNVRNMIAVYFSLSIYLEDEITGRAVPNIHGKKFLIDNVLWSYPMSGIDTVSRSY